MNKTAEILKKEFEAMLSRGVSPMFEIGEHILYIKYRDNVLFCGTATNVGVAEDVSIIYDESFTFDENLQILYEEALDDFDEY